MSKFDINAVLRRSKHGDVCHTVVKRSLGRCYPSSFWKVQSDLSQITEWKWFMVYTTLFCHSYHYFSRFQEARLIRLKTTTWTAVPDLDHGMTCVNEAVSEGNTRSYAVLYRCITLPPASLGLRGLNGNHSLASKRSNPRKFPFLHHIACGYEKKVSAGCYCSYRSKLIRPSKALRVLCRCIPLNLSRTTGLPAQWQYFDRALGFILIADLAFPALIRVGYQLVEDSIAGIMS